MFIVKYKLVIFDEYDCVDCMERGVILWWENLYLLLLIE